MTVTHPGRALVLGLALAIVPVARVEASTCAETSTVLLVRHAQTAWNISGRLQGNADVPLDETGRTQAQALARALAATPIDAVYSSPLARALDTARAIAAPRRLAVLTRDALREIGAGIYTGHLPSEVPPELRRAWNSDPTVAMPSGVPDSRGMSDASAAEGRWFEGESLDMVVERAWGEIRALAAEHCGKRIVVVTHGGVIQTVIARAKGASVTDFRKFPVPNASRTTLEFRPNGPAIVPSDR